MTIRIFPVLRIAALAGIAAAAPAFAQSTTPPPTPPTLKGAYVLSEHGADSSTLASFMFAENGSATGTSMVQAGFNVATYALSGAYVANDDGSITLKFSATSADAVNDDGNPLGYYEVLWALPRSSGAFSTVRQQVGADVGELVPAGTVPALSTGDYQVSGRDIGPADTSVELIKVDSAGNVSGEKVTNSYGAMVRKSLKGAVTTTKTGFQQIAVNVSYTDDSGNAVVAPEVFMALTTQKDVRMIQTVGGFVGGLLTLSQ